jgi:hypothetical protein
MKVVADLFKGRGLNYGIERLKNWVAQCKQLHKETEAKKIADAQFDPRKVEQWQRSFWETYSPSSPVLSMCLRNGNYQIDKDVCSQMQERLLKVALIDWKYPLVGGGGNDHGRRFARYTEGQLLGKMVAGVRGASQAGADLRDLMSKASASLKKRSCEGENGMIVVMTKHGPTSQLYRDDNYVPSWREDVRSLGFDGFYQGFPIVWYKEAPKRDEDKQEAREPRPERVVAVDLRGWKGVRARERVVTEREFGELTIRTWTEEEIQKALESKELEPKDVNRAKGNCPVGISLYWESSPVRPPHVRAFQLPGGGPQPEDHSRPTEQQETRD